MIKPMLRSPGEFATVALAIGLVGKWVTGPTFSAGWTMIAILWVLPLVSVGLIDEYRAWASERDGPGFFASQEKRTELLALLALPGLGFALDFGLASYFILAPLGVGAVGVWACVQLARIRRNDRITGDDR